MLSSRVVTVQPPVAQSLNFQISYLTKAAPQGIMGACVAGIQSVSPCSLATSAGRLHPYEPQFALLETALPSLTSSREGWTHVYSAPSRIVPPSLPEMRRDWVAAFVSPHQRQLGFGGVKQNHKENHLVDRVQNTHTDAFSGFIITCFSVWVCCFVLLSIHLWLFS